MTSQFLFFISSPSPFDLVIHSDDNLFAVIKEKTINENINDGSQKHEQVKSSAADERTTHSMSPKAFDTDERNSLELKVKKVLESQL